MSEVEKNMLIQRYIIGRETDMVNKYIADGPGEMMESLGLNQAQWKVVFDYLVFNEDLLFKCVKQASAFFEEQYIQHGSGHVRELLNIVEEQYDKVWEYIFDHLALAKEAVYMHVMHNRDKYIVAFKARGGDFVRKVLGLWKEKYEENWLKILDLLLHGVCDGLFSEQTFEHGLMGFNRIVNSMREHRPIEKSEIGRLGMV